MSWYFIFRSTANLVGIIWSAARLNLCSPVLNSWIITDDLSEANITCLKSTDEKCYNLLEYVNEPLDFWKKVIFSDENEARSEATFRFAVSNFSRLRKTALSPPTYVRNLPWKIMVMPHTSRGKGRQQRTRSLGFFLQCNNGESKSSTWSCNAIADLRLISQKEGVENFSRQIQHLFCSKEIDWGFISFMSWNEVLDPEKGFIKDDTIILEVSVTADAPHGVSEKDCVVPADVPDSTIDTENPKDEDLSSIDTKDVTLLTECMKELMIKGSDHDVKIIVKDKEFRAHRIILRTRSPVLAMMLSHDTKESNTGTIKIEDCDPDSFDEFLLYVYCGRTENLTPSKAFHLYYTADKYDLPALKERCAMLLKTSLSVASICDVILLAVKHGDKELLEVATKFFARNMREILVTVRWQEFLSAYPIEGNELYIKSMDILVPKK